MYHGEVILEADPTEGDRVTERGRIFRGLLEGII